ncbi:hypothetical protein [Demequina sp.]|uniref:hypothetical protein n=1 Tax=Demequina sp. TaxID=2050685 RepID=UPI003D10141C
MKTTALARLAVVAVAVAALSACSAINPITSQNEYQASDGFTVDLGDDARVINVLVMTTAKDAPAVMTGSIYNGGTEELEVTLSIDGTLATNVEVPAKSTVVLGTGEGQELVQGASPAAPGGLATVWFGTEDAGAIEAQVPVVDGTIDPYQNVIDSIPPLPEPSASPEPSTSPEPSASPSA